MNEGQAVAPSFSQTVDWEAKKRSVFSGLFFCAFLSLCTRGVYEITIGKVFAYGAQVGLWSLVLFSSVTIFRYRTTTLLSIGIVLTFLFGISAMISSMWTLEVASFQGGLIATLVNVYLLLLFVAGYGFQSEAFSAKPIVISMAVAGISLPIFGILQLAEFSIFELPGRSLLRPPSLTGSYLHFPLICGLLAIFLLEGAKALRWRFLYAISFLCLIGVVISGGRSGTFVLAGTCGLYLFFEFSKRPAATKLKFGSYALVAILMFAILFAAAYQYVPTLQRIARLWDLQERGNYYRILIWSSMYDYWRHTNLWFGEFTGLIGNTTGNVNGTNTNESQGNGTSGLVAELGALQQLMNFGVLGLLSFYGVMLLAYRAIEKDCTFLRALFISAMIQTLFYQSTEVLPYMAMLAFMPLFSRTLVIAGGDRYSNQGR